MCISREGQKHRLKDIVGVRLARDAAAHAQHPVAVPLHQRRKRIFIPSTNKTVQEFPIRRRGGLKEGIQACGRGGHVTFHVRIVHPI